MTDLVYTVIIGFITGAIAKFIMPGKDPGGCIVTTLLGIGGAMLFTYLGKRLGFGDARFIGAIIGAILILWLYRMIKK